MGSRDLGLMDNRVPMVVRGKEETVMDRLRAAVPVVDMAARVALVVVAPVVAAAALDMVRKEVAVAVDMDDGVKVRKPDLKVSYLFRISV